jgi:hypothetical protein
VCVSDQLTTVDKDLQVDLYLQLQPQHYVCMSPTHFLKKNIHINYNKPLCFPPLCF